MMMEHFFEPLAKHLGPDIFNGVIFVFNQKTAMPNMQKKANPNPTLNFMNATSRYG